MKPRESSARFGNNVGHKACVELGAASIVVGVITNRINTGPLRLDDAPAAFSFRLCTVSNIAVIL
jgi:hypothetical protein